MKKYIVQSLSLAEPITIQADAYDVWPDNSATFYVITEKWFGRDAEKVAFISNITQIIQKQS